ncbi:uncharacterized protein MONBRDRAFT_12804 [Monosiga brevicollis MX1]|uniref:Uncharacterized protein n=1 Tax=Monosiga brevicollis TaxID=81824 RepID=A9VDD4_MONBE|nr:uncharacterized protein MONBRDRAFT_12804 [Monosiga brevicollis MX1]EDQ84429.1 predicted protein [Monosiga brevicollis MX1]|eukprot:XP_001750724.1 hypothetical protein [Monosiga brevicollis MX1]
MGLERTGAGGGASATCRGRGVWRARTLSSLRLPLPLLLAVLLVLVNVALRGAVQADIVHGLAVVQPRLVLEQQQQQLDPFRNMTAPRTWPALLVQWLGPWADFAPSYQTSHRVYPAKADSRALGSATPLPVFELLQRPGTLTALVQDDAGALVYRSDTQVAPIPPDLNTWDKLFQHIQTHQPTSSLVIFPERFSHTFALDLDPWLYDDYYQALTDAFNVPVTQHVYITGPAGRALNPHTDGGDVFVRQISGSKHWQLCVPRLQDPSVCQPSAPSPTAHPCTDGARARYAEWKRDQFEGCTPYTMGQLADMDCSNITLHPGDTLYLPRGIVHHAWTDSGITSTHVTYQLQSKDATLFDRLRNQCYARASTGTRWCDSLDNLVANNFPHATSDLLRLASTLHEDKIAAMLWQLRFNYKDLMTTLARPRRDITSKDHPPPGVCCDDGCISSCDTWVECDEGEYYVSIDDDCANCPSGKYQTDRDHIKRTCIDKTAACDAGKYLVVTSSSSDNYCATCSEGKYQASAGYAGTSCSDKLATCGLGQYLSISNSVTQDNSCINCPVQTSYQDQASHSDTSCKARVVLTCGLGQRLVYEDATMDNRCVSCTSGTYQDQASHADVTCKPQRTSCNAGRHLKLADNTADNTCTRCPAACDSSKGYHTTQSSSTSCTTCPAGQYLTFAYSADGGCVACPSGKYRNDEELADCLNCGAGRYSRKPGQSTCKTCPAGKYSDDGANEECQACSEGKYSGSQASTCQTCPTGTYQPNQSSSNCLPCAEGLTVLADGRDCQDVTPPVIQVPLGPIVTEVLNASFSLPAITAVDGYDGPVATSTLDSFDIARAEIQRLNYTAADEAGNAAWAVLIVNVLAAQKPSIVLYGDDPMQQEAGEPFVDPLATVHDSLDPNIGVLSDASSQVDTAVLGTYTVTYQAARADHQGLWADPVTRNVIVEDTKAPVLTLRGVARFIVQATFAYLEPGFSAQDAFDGNLTAMVKQSLASAQVDTHVPSGTSYEIMYTVSDRAGNEASLARTVVVMDTYPPNIHLNGSLVLNLEAGTSFVDPGYWAHDLLDGNRPVSVSGSYQSVPSVAVPANYTLTYSSRDEAGNLGQSHRTIQVVDTTPPVIETIGQVQTLEAAPPTGVYELQPGWFVVTDNYVQFGLGGRLQSNVSSLPLRPPALPYPATVLLTVTDDNDNTGHAHLAVRIVDSLSPVLNVTDTIVEGGSSWHDDQPWSALDRMDGDVRQRVRRTSLALVHLGGQLLPDTPNCPSEWTHFASAASRAAQTQRWNVLLNNSWDAVYTQAPNGSTFVLDYGVTDAAGNSGTAQRRVTIRDTQPPIIDAPASPVLLEYGTIMRQYSDPATAWDALDGDLTAFLCYTIRAFDFGGSILQRVPANAVDGQLLPASPQNWSTLVSAAQVAQDGTLFAQHVNWSRVTAADYPVNTQLHVQYSVTDGAAWTTTHQRWLKVVDTTPPVINVYPASSTVPFGTRLPLTWHEALDNHDGNISRYTVVEGRQTLSVTQVGRHYVNYTCQDQFGNVATTVQTIVVDPFERPSLEYIVRVTYKTPPASAPTAAVLQATLRSKTKEPFAFVVGREAGNTAEPDMFNALPDARALAQDQSVAQSRRQLLGSAEETYFYVCIRDQSSLEWISGEDFALRLRDQLSSDPNVVDVTPSEEPTSTSSSNASATTVMVGVIVPVVLLVLVVAAVLYRRHGGGRAASGKRDAQQVGQAVVSLDESSTGMMENPVYRPSMSSNSYEAMYGVGSRDEASTYGVVGASAMTISNSLDSRTDGTYANAHGFQSEFPEASFSLNTTGGVQLGDRSRQLPESDTDGAFISMTQDTYDMPNASETDGPGDYDMPNAQELATSALQHMYATPYEPPTQAMSAEYASPYEPAGSTLAEYASPYEQPSSSTPPEYAVPDHATPSTQLYNVFRSAGNSSHGSVGSIPQATHSESYEQPVVQAQEGDRYEEPVVQAQEGDRYEEPVVQPQEGNRYEEPVVQAQEGDRYEEPVAGAREHGGYEEPTQQGPMTSGPVYAQPVTPAAFAFGDEATAAEEHLYGVGTGPADTAPVEEAMYGTTEVSVPLAVQVQAHSTYVENLPREKVERMLKGRTPGSFFMRHSANNDKYVVSALVAAKQATHYVVEQQGQTWTFNNEPVPGVTSLSELLHRLSETDNSLSKIVLRSAAWLSRDVPPSMQAHLALEQQPWFHGQLSRDATENMLHTASKDGAWLLRERRSASYALSLIRAGTVTHHLLEFDQQGFVTVNGTRLQPRRRTMEAAMSLLLLQPPLLSNIVLSQPVEKS